MNQYRADCVQIVVVAASERPSSGFRHLRGYKENVNLFYCDFVFFSLLYVSYISFHVLSLDEDSGYASVGTFICHFTLK